MAVSGVLSSWASFARESRHPTRGRLGGRRVRDRRCGLLRARHGAGPAELLGDFSQDFHSAAGEIRSGRRDERLSRRHVGRRFDLHDVKQQNFRAIFALLRDPASHPPELATLPAKATFRGRLCQCRPRRRSGAAVRRRAWPDRAQLETTRMGNRPRAAAPEAFAERISAASASIAMTACASCPSSGAAPSRRSGIAGLAASAIVKNRPFQRLIRNARQSSK